MAVLLTIFGIGFLLFIHELGHFLAARAAGVRVEVFALGMGPRVAGFKRNGTDYRLAAIPIGGYVKMAGEDLSGNGGPDELFSKPPRWRFLIFSGGILMNFLFALIMIPILFRIGVPVQAPIVGSVESGSPAWQAGLQSGDRLVSMNGSKLHSFSDFASMVALSGIGELLELDIITADGEGRRIEFKAVYDEASGFPKAGVYQATSAVIAADSVATRAGILPNSTLDAIDGIPVNNAGSLQALLFEATLQGSEIELTTSLDGETQTTLLHPEKMEPSPNPQLGVYEARQVVNELHSAYDTGLQIGDRIIQAGSLHVRGMEVIHEASLRNANRVPELKVVRNDQVISVQPELNSSEFAAAVWLQSEKNLLRVTVRPGGPAALAGLQNGDVIRHLGGEQPENFHELRTSLKVWIEAARQTEKTEIPPLPIMAMRGNKTIELEVNLAATPTWDYGIGLTGRVEVVQETSIVAAIGTGFSRAKAMVRDAFLSFQRILTGQISTKNLGGIITIGRTTHSIASVGIIPFLFFLSMISIHLGVLNLLPIPALDGGHLLFLLIEAIRGKPVSERVQIWFNLGGFVLVMSLVVFVTILDIKRLVP